MHTDLMGRLNRHRLPRSMRRCSVRSVHAGLAHPVCARIACHRPQVALRARACACGSKRSCLSAQEAVSCSRHACGQTSELSTG
jgi:hypothetical protein